MRILWRVAPLLGLILTLGAGAEARAARSEPERQSAEARNDVAAAERRVERSSSYTTNPAQLRTVWTTNTAQSRTVMKETPLNPGRSRQETPLNAGRFGAETPPKTPPGNPESNQSTE